MKTRKNMTRPHVSVHFENGQNAKNARENQKNVQLGHMPLCILKMGQMPKTLMKPRKMYSQATLNGPNAKNG